MNVRTILIGIGLFVFVIIFFVAASRLFSRSGTASSTATVLSASNPSDHLTPCTPDPDTGLCNGKKKNLSGDSDRTAFMEAVQVHQRSSSSFSSSRTRGVSVLDRLRASRGSSSSRSNSSRSFLQTATHVEGQSQSGGSDQQSSCRSFAQSRGVSGDNPYPADCYYLKDTGTGPGSQSHSTSTGVTVTSRGLQGSIGTVPRGRCLRSRSLLAIFDFGEMTTGREGWTFPVLIHGDCPISAAILKGPDNADGFGGSTNDF